MYNYSSMKSLTCDTFIPVQFSSEVPLKRIITPYLNIKYEPEACRHLIYPDIIGRGHLVNLKQKCVGEF